MNEIGIDVSSKKSTVAVLADQLRPLDGETRVVMEHYGRYYEFIWWAWYAWG